MIQPITPEAPEVHLTYQDEPAEQTAERFMLCQEKGLCNDTALNSLAQKVLAIAKEAGDKIMAIYEKDSPFRKAGSAR